MKGNWNQLHCLTFFLIPWKWKLQLKQGFKLFKRIQKEIYIASNPILGFFIRLTWHHYNYNHTPIYYNHESKIVLCDPLLLYHIFWYLNHEYALLSNSMLGLWSETLLGHLCCYPIFTLKGNTKHCLFNKNNIMSECWWLFGI
jgi:hypothetical protein